jgi:O-antigen ligase
MAGPRDSVLAGETGLLLWVATIAWTLMSAAASGGHPWPEVALLVAVGVAYIGGSVAGSAARWLAPMVVAAAALSLMLVAPGDVFGRGALQGPFHYANAKGAFFAVASLAALMVATAMRSRGPRAAAVGAAALCAAVPFVIGSFAAGILAVALGPAALAAALAGRTRVFVVGMGALALAALGCTILLGSLFHPAGGQAAVERFADQALSERRPALWHDALALMVAHPIFGVGPARFQVTSPVALSDRDARWAHNEFLQQGAEQGVPGLLLSILGFGWGFARLAAARPGRFTALGAAVLGTLAIHGSIDYVMHFPAIPISVAALVGAAAASRRSGSTRPMVRAEGNGHVVRVARS